jgi:hypothetical protein
VEIAGEAIEEWNLPKKPLERSLRGEKVSNTVDLTSKLQKLPQSCPPEWRKATTRSCADGGVEPEHEVEYPDEARARGGGPKHRRSTSQYAKELVSHTHQHGGHPQKRHRRLRPEQADEASGGARVHRR